MPIEREVGKPLHVESADFAVGKCDKIKPVTGWPEARDRALVESYLDAKYDD